MEAVYPIVNYSVGVFLGIFLGLVIVVAMEEWLDRPHSK